MPANCISSLPRASASSRYVELCLDSRTSSTDGCGRDSVELREILVEVSLPQRGDGTLVGGFTVAAVNFLHYLHAGGNLAKRREAHLVELRVISCVDEQLRGARIFAGGGEGDETGLIALRDRIVLEIRFAPDVVDGGIGAQAELDYESGDDSKERGLLVKAVLDEIVEAVRAERRPCARDLHDEIARGGLELHIESIRSRLFQIGGLKQCWLRGHGDSPKDREGMVRTWIF